MAEITIRVSDRVLKIAGAVLALALVSWIFSQLWESGFFRAKYHLKMYVSEADSLSVGSPVRVAGIKVGNVQAKNLAQMSTNPTQRILLDLRIEKRHQNLIRADSSARLVGEGLLGNEYVDVTRGFNGAPLTDGEEITSIPIKKLTSQEFWDTVAKVAECMKETKESISGATFPPATDPPKHAP